MSQNSPRFLASANLQTTLPLFFLQLRGPAAALSRKFLRDLTTARHFEKFFIICIIRIFTTEIEKFQLRGDNSMCAGAFQLLRGRALAQLRGNMAYNFSVYQSRMYDFRLLIRRI
jgi:hypothetical protein